MKLGIMKLSMVGVILALVVVAGSTVAFAQDCPTTSPSYSPDFTSNQNCLTLNPSAAFGVPAYNLPTSGPPPTNPPGAPNPPVPPQTGVNTVLRLTPNATFVSGSAWFNTQQPVAAAFSTTFVFQLSGANPFVADGIAFVIQNSLAGTSALGPEGCGLGFGGSTGPCKAVDGPQSGIPNSLAVEFDTYQNTDVGDPSNNHVAIQTCGTQPNTVDLTCRIADNDLTKLPSPINMADGNFHTVTISYALQPAPSQTNCLVDGTPGPCLDVILDGVDLFPLGVPVNFNSLLTLNGGNAWVGFTGATGGGNDNQDIWSWTFTPQAQSQAGTVTPGGEPIVLTYNGGFVEGSPTSGFDYTAQETDTTQTLGMVVTAIPQTNQNACNALVQANPSFNTAECFVYQNGGGQGVDAPVMFEVTCPPSGSCGSNENPFDANLASDFTFTCDENSPLTCGPLPAPFSFGLPNLTSTDGLPEVGYLKGEGPDPNHPCTPWPSNTPPLFQSNQIISINIVDTGSKPIKAGSGGTTSCWVATYLTGGEVPSVSVTAPVNGGTYQQNEQDASTLANYTCTAVNTGNSATGPYLTVASCTGSVASGAYFDTSTTGPHTFVVDVQDSATNTNEATVTYNVLGAQSITFAPIASPQTYGSGPIPLSASASSGLPVSLASQTMGVCTVSGSTVMLVGVGTCTIQATQAGDGSFYKAAPPVNQSFQVIAATTTTKVTSSLNPSISGQSVTFTANVAGGGSPGGSMTWSANTGCGVTPVAAGVAKCTTSSLPVGADTITANYSGDPDNGASAGMLNQVVDLAPAITSGNSVTFAYGVLGSFTVTTTGYPTPSLSYTGTLPSGVSFTNNGNGTGTLGGTPTQSGTFNITFTASNGVNPAAMQPFTLMVSGPLVSLTPASVNLGTVYLYLDLNFPAFTLKNNGTSTLNISNVSLTLGGGTNPADFTPVSLCPSKLAAGKSCLIYVVFFAGNIGTPSATLNVTDNAPGSPQQASLSATVINPQASFNPSSLNFGTVKAKSHSSPQNVTLSNPGTTPLIISNNGISVTGANAADFVQSNNCPASLAPTKQCTISVTFTPSATGNRSAYLTVNDNAIVGTQYVPLSGKGN